MPSATCKKCRKRFAYKAAEVRTEPRCHRLLCGDSTRAEDVARVMGGEKAEVLWTDAPYGVSYVGKTKDALEIANDNAADLPALLQASFEAADEVLNPGARFYIAAPAGPQGIVFRQVIIGIGWKFHQALVWVKNSMVLGHSDYHYRHEDILYGWKVGDHQWYGDRTQTSVLEIDRPSRSEEHPTMKPPELVTRCLVNSSKAGDLVLDSFLGSGTTIVAGEQTGRLVAGIEIEPKYASVCLERLSGMGLEPRRETPAKLPRIGLGPQREG